MDELLKDLPLYGIAVIFILSLLGSVVLFKYLKSSALIKKSQYQAGGAIAGFILIYLMLFSSWLKTMEVCSPKLWTVAGVVKREAAAKHDGIKISYVPPEPSTITNLSGEFRLMQVPMANGEKRLEVQIESKGYFPVTQVINKDNALIEEDKKIIRLKDIIEISRIGE